MPSRRLTDRIRELCAKALDRQQPDWDATLSELQFAIQEHTLRLSNMSVAASVAGQMLKERRQTPEASPIPQGIRTLFALHSRKRLGSTHRKSRIGMESSSRTSSHSR
jgi:hypothetical protein